MFLEECFLYVAGKNMYFPQCCCLCFAGRDDSQSSGSLRFLVTAPPYVHMLHASMPFSPHHLPTSPLIPSSSPVYSAAYFNVPLQSIRLHNSTAVRRSKRRCCKTTEEWGMPCNVASLLFFPPHNYPFFSTGEACTHAWVGDWHLAAGVTEGMMTKSRLCAWVIRHSDHSATAIFILWRRHNVAESSCPLQQNCRK